MVRAKNTCRSLQWFWFPAPKLWDKWGRHFRGLGPSPSPAWCQVLEPFIYHSRWQINSLGLIYGDRQELLPAEPMPLSLCLDFVPLPVPEEPWHRSSSWIFRARGLITDWSTCPLDPQDYVFFSFLIFKEAYLQGEGKVSQRGDGGGRESKCAYAKSSIPPFEWQWRHILSNYRFSQTG